jgi:sec-independent protein translocase protein TatB
MARVLGSLDPAKIFVILVVALIVLGPERLPRAARQLGATWREISRIREQVREEVSAVIPQVDLPRIPQGAVSGFIRDLTSPLAGTTASGQGAEGEAAAGLGEDGAGPPGGGASSVPAWVGGHEAGSAGEGVPIAADDPGMN